MHDDLYLRLAQPADSTDGLKINRGDHCPVDAVTATHTETIETTDNDRAGVLLGNLSL